MHSLSSTIIMAVTYSHDIATALLAVGGITLWIISSNYPVPATPGTELYFTRLYGSITRLAKYALLWVLAAGVPRIVFYMQYEWSDKAGDLQVVAIVIKHIVMFLLVGTGLFYWVKLGRKIKELQLKHNTSPGG